MECRRTPLYLDRDRRFHSRQDQKTLRTNLCDETLADHEDGESVPYYVQPKDVAVADESLQPLPWVGAGPPRNIRVFHRARYYWMVTYLARVGDEDRKVRDEDRKVRDEDSRIGEDRLFWGAIDWAEQQPTLRPLSTPQEFDDANCMVGLV